MKNVFTVLLFGRDDIHIPLEDLPQMDGCPMLTKDGEDQIGKWLKENKGAEIHKEYQETRSWKQKVFDKIDEVLHGNND